MLIPWKSHIGNQSEVNYRIKAEFALNIKGVSPSLYDDGMLICRIIQLMILSDDIDIVYLFIYTNTFFYFELHVAIIYVKGNIWVVSLYALRLVHQVLNANVRVHNYPNLLYHLQFKWMCVQIWKII